MKFCLIVFLTATVAQGQSAITVSQKETTGQKTNTTLPMMNNSIQSVGANHLLVYSPPKENNSTHWKLPNSESENTNNSVLLSALQMNFRP